MSEIEKHTGAAVMSAADQFQFAETLTKGDLVPKDYRGKPANALLAINLGQAMGLNPAEALSRIDVIQGKPTASAELIASNVRKAGHRLRVSGDEQSVTATIIRADDPEHEFTVTRDVAWAKRMGLDQKDNYKRQPGTMLQWRAITAVARLACSESLYGVTYTADELQDDRPAPAAQKPAQQAPTGGSRLASAIPAVEPETVEAEPQQDDEPRIPEQTWQEISELCAQQGIESAPRWVQDTLGRSIQGYRDITVIEGDRLLRLLTTGEAEEG